MSKTFETKRKIIRIISARNSTLTDVSRLLGLASSTVSKHLKELEAQGLITLVPNPYIKKWKYYSINRLEVGPIETRPTYERGGMRMSM